ncbi:MAG: transglycosylase SLT domain-containing protein [Actinomycetota bacterium]
MTEINPLTQRVEALGAERLAAIGDRLRARGIDPSRGQSFESLLARAQTADPTAAPAPTDGPIRVDTASGGGASLSAVLGRSGPGQAVIDAGLQHLGVPYLWGGTDPEHGFDCSGLVQDAYRKIGVDMPKWSRHQATMGVEVPSLDDALPGDVIAFGEPVNHVGLYMGDGQMLHAPRTGDVVKVDTIKRPIATIRRIVSPGGAPAVLPDAGPVTSTGAPSASTATGAAAANRAVAGSAVAASPARYQALFAAAGEQWGVDPDLLAAVARTESNFNPSAVSPVGAQGLMQFMPATAAEMGVDPWDPASAIDGAARYLRTSIDQFDTIEEAIASYNAGRGAVSRHGGVPPYSETRRYVQKVLAAWGEG